MPLPHAFGARPAAVPAAAGLDRAQAAPAPKLPRCARASNGKRSLRLSGMGTALAATLMLQWGGGAQAAEYRTHASWAEDLVARVAPADNVYQSSPTTVTWPGVLGATRYQNASACSPFVTRVIRAAYGISATTFKSMLGSSSPTSSEYHHAIVNQRHFHRVAKPEDIERNDILASTYLPCANSSATGHTMIALSAARRRTVDTEPIIAGTVQYEVTIADSTSSPRPAVDTAKQVYTDTRTTGSVTATGAGISTIRLYKNVTTGEIAGYTWSMYRNSTYQPVEGCKSIAVGRLN